MCKILCAIFYGFDILLLYFKQSNKDSKVYKNKHKGKTAIISNIIGNIMIHLGRQDFNIHVRYTGVPHDNDTVGIHFCISLP